eukprot:TRINITY_DN2771_c1_g2_i1.p1 TRINITY_DN2771_c1_g2~~TRINITY_DN2771_c1_g2_i1.p1  ORF type:complete len:455 (-),score=122.51 TRINITY_DN2771_c1_g2_i1:14-1378(-)
MSDSEDLENSAKHLIDPETIIKQIPPTITTAQHPKQSKHTKMTSSQTVPKIAIIGAGPAGLTLASLLHKHDNLTSTVTVFEMRSKPSDSMLQTPSGNLDLHPGSGLLAIEECGLASAFKSFNAECSEEMITADKNAVVQLHLPGDGNRPEISRNALNHILLTSFPQEIVRWDTKIRSVTPGESKKWKISFNDNESEEFDFVVGADGAWSKARLAIPGTSKPTYSGVSYLALTVPYLTQKYPSLSTLIGSGSYLALGHMKGIISQRGILDSARMYLMMSVDSATYFSDTGLDSLPPNQLKEKLLGEEQYFKDWNDQLKDLIAAGCDAEEKVEARPLYTQPTKHSWTHVPGITLIGDAAHLMVPSGEGVNLGMLDALELSKALTSSLGDEVKLDEEVKAFEEKMWMRSEDEAQSAGMMQAVMYKDPDAPKLFLELMNTLVEGSKNISQTVEQELPK